MGALLGLRQPSCRFRSWKGKAVAVRQPTDTALQSACGGGICAIGFCSPLAQKAAEFQKSKLCATYSVSGEFLENKRAPVIDRSYSGFSAAC
jgi:hypothetical protein